MSDQDSSLAIITDKDIMPLFERALISVREELRNNPYIEEAIRVLEVRGYRSAIGNFWNAVVDDLRNKIMHRSLELFNKSVNVGREIKIYEDFQNYVNDDQLIEGAYKIGVIGYEASKVLRHAKETRHLFSGHPKSSDPSVIKVLAMMDDCTKYVLNVPYPSKIIDIDSYMSNLDSTDFDRNDVAIEVALTELPEIYKEQLANRLFSAYIHPNSSSTIRSNIEYVVPILWPVLAKSVQIQIVRRVDQEIPKGNATVTEQAFNFVTHLGATSYLSPAARRYKIEPLVQNLKASLDTFKIEDRIVRELRPFASVIPPESVDDYVWALTQTYVGQMGSSPYFSRTNFYADGAARHIPKMFELFDDRASEAFVRCMKSNSILKSRIQQPVKLGRLRSLANIVLGKASTTFADRELLELLVDEEKEKEFFEELRKA